MAPTAAEGIVKDQNGTSYDVIDALSLPTSTGWAGPPKFTDPPEERQYLKGRLALAFRIFAKLGFDEGPGSRGLHKLLGDPFGVAWPLLKASDLIRVNAKGKIVEGGPIKLLNTAAYMIHHAVHEARPEVNCVAHSHSVYVRAFSALGRTLDTISQDSCAFYNDLAFYDSFGGIVIGEGEARLIAEALGNRKATILANHGLFTTGKSIKSTVICFMSLDSCCRRQLLADAAAVGRGREMVKIVDKEAVFTFKTVGSEVTG